MVTSKLHVLLNVSVPCWQIFKRLLLQGFLDERIKMGGNNPMLTSKVHVLWNTLAQLTDFHKTYIARILLMRWSKWGAQSHANFKSACFVKYLSSMLTDFDETFIAGILMISRIKMRGNILMQTSMLHVLWNISAPYWQILMRLL